MIDGDRCFQIMGFDVFLDKKCKPYIIEINHNPSFKLPTPLDVEIKTAALSGCLGIVCDKYMPYPEDDTPCVQRSRSVSLDASEGAASDASMAAAIERDREALFRNTGLGRRQQQQQEAFAPSSFTRALSSGSVEDSSSSSRTHIPSVCMDASGGHVISSRQWSLQTLYDHVGDPQTHLQVWAVGGRAVYCWVLC